MTQGKGYNFQMWESFFKEKVSKYFILFQYCMTKCSVRPVIMKKQSLIKLLFFVHIMRTETKLRY